jgi:hypothetical protein
MAVSSRVLRDLLTVLCRVLTRAPRLQALLWLMVAWCRRPKG